MQPLEFAQEEVAAWLTTYPSYPLTTDLRIITTALAHWQASLPSHIIVVDAQQRPLGAVAVGRLWQVHQPPSTAPLSALNLPPSTAEFPWASPTAQLLDCQAWLEAIVLIPVHSSLADLGTYLQATTARCWVAVNGAGQYQGVINPATVLRRMTVVPSDQAASQRGDQPGRERQWVMAISHALKTPLTSLLGLSTLLLDHRVGSLTERQMRYAILMRRAIRKLIRLINQLVDWMRLDSDQLILDLAPLDLQALADSLIPSFLTSCLPDATAPPDWITSFSLQIPPAVPLPMADRLRVQQSLHGVLDYFLQRGADPQGFAVETWGHWLGLTLWSAPAVQAQPASPQPWDGGVGRQPENDGLEHLGLALAQRLCQLQGGELTGFYSERYGYRLTLLLPLAPAAANPNTSIVLLVSPQASLVEQVYDLLQASDYRLVIALHWEAARTAMQRLAVRAILLDGEALDLAPALAIQTLQTWPTAPALRVILGPMPDLARQSEASNTAEVVCLPISSLRDRLLPTLSQAIAPPLPPPPVPLGPPPRSEADMITLLIVPYPARGANPSQTVGLSSPWRLALQAHHCRLLQAADLAQARLLYRVWQPQAIVLDSLQVPSLADWQQIAQHKDWVQVPWVSLMPLPTPHPPGLTLVDGSSVLAQPIEQGVLRLLQMIQMIQLPSTIED